MSKSLSYLTTNFDYTKLCAVCVEGDPQSGQRRHRKPTVKEDQGGWSGNALLFATKEEAQSYADDLMNRWTLVCDTRVDENPEPANSKWDAETRTITNLERGTEHVPPYRVTL